MTLAEKIQRVAREKGLELKRVAEKAGIPYNTLRGYTAQGNIPSAPNGIALAKALDVGIEWLFDDSQGWPPPGYHEPPPFTIKHWPPNGISWEELHLAIEVYVQQRSYRSIEEMKRRIDKEPSPYPPHISMDRDEVIEEARRQHASTHEENRKVWSEFGWINEALQYRGLPLLTHEEAKGLGIKTE